MSTVVYIVKTASGFLADWFHGSPKYTQNADDAALFSRSGALKVASSPKFTSGQAYSYNIDTRSLRKIYAKRIAAPRAWKLRAVTDIRAAIGKEAASEFEKFLKTSAELDSLAKKAAKIAADERRKFDSFCWYARYN